MVGERAQARQRGELVVDGVDLWWLVVVGSGELVVDGVDMWWWLVGSGSGGW